MHQGQTPALVTAAQPLRNTPHPQPPPSQHQIQHLLDINIHIPSFRPTTAEQLWASPMSGSQLWPFFGQISVTGPILHRIKPTTQFTITISAYILHQALSTKKLVIVFQLGYRLIENFCMCVKGFVEQNCKGKPFEGQCPFQTKHKLSSKSLWFVLF